MFARWLPGYHFEAWRDKKCLFCLAYVKPFKRERGSVLGLAPVSLRARAQLRNTETSARVTLVLRMMLVHLRTAHQLRISVSIQSAGKICDSVPAAAFIGGMSPS